MSDLISRQAAINALENTECELLPEEWDELTDAIKNLPSAQPERKRGKWRHYEGYLTCSECGTEYDDDIMMHCCDDVPKFCPNCGADMRGGDDENDRC